MSIPRDEDTIEEQYRTLSDVIATVIGVLAGGAVFYVLYLHYLMGRVG